MGRVLLLSLGLWSMLEGRLQAQNSQPRPTIMGPDGRGSAPLAPKPPQPTLEEQLQKRRKQEQELEELKKKMPDQPSTSTDDLLAPHEKAQIADLQKEMDLAPRDARMRVSLGLAPASAQRVGGSIKTWRFDPGTVFAGAFRLTDPKKSYTFWTGISLGAWNGTGRSEESFARFTALYIGPLFAFEWQGALRHSLNFGIAGISRQADPNFPGNADKLATKSFGLDGSGLWLSYGLGIPLTPGFDFETKIGVQSGAAYTLTWFSLGVSLWTD